MTTSSFAYTPRLPPNSLILITGVNGLMASHVADQALQAGYRVRGTVRSAAKASWMSDLFTTKYGPDIFSLVEVPDIVAEGAFDDAVKDVAGIAHIAAILGSTDPEVMIPGSVNSDLSVLNSAAKEPSVKAVVLTSSSWAQSIPQPNKKFNIDKDTWNEWAAEHAYDKPYGADKLMTVYAASKVLGERACWKFMKENNAGFVFNSGELQARGCWIAGADEGHSAPSSKFWKSAGY
jgi:nucleoside-diphosphate-sugar epimerase